MLFNKPNHLLSEEIISSVRSISSAKTTSDEVKSESAATVLSTALIVSSSFSLFIELVILVA